MAAGLVDKLNNKERIWGEKELQGFAGIHFSTSLARRQTFLVPQMRTSFGEMDASII